MAELAPTRPPTLLACPGCDSPLPLRLPALGEVAGSWECNYCHERFHAVFVDSASPDSLGNARPCEDVNPRVVVAGKTVAKLHKREDHTGRVLDERRSNRRAGEFALSVNAGDKVIKVWAVDISAGGVGFVSDVPLATGAVITAGFEALPGAPVAEAVVRSCREAQGGLFRIGASFTHTLKDDAAPSPESASKPAWRESDSH